MLAGHTPVIIDREREATPPRGFFYLHDNCNLPLTPQAIQVYKTGGTSAEYSQKVYGGVNDNVSFGKNIGQRSGYDPAEALNILNGLQNGMVKQRSIRSFHETVLSLREDYARVIFTLPINRFLPGTWKYQENSVEVFKLDEGEDLQNFCVYSADSGIPWYRAGAMFGYAFREFPYVKDGCRVVTKVIGGGSMIGGGSALPAYKNFLFTGRFGSWSKQLAHESFQQVLNWLTSKEG
jgi:hypothetical protein